MGVDHISKGHIAGAGRVPAEILLHVEAARAGEPLLPARPAL